MTIKKQERWRRILRKAIKILENNHWNQGCLARNSKNEPVNVESEEACSFCIVGSIYKANNEKADYNNNYNPSFYALEAVEKITAYTGKKVALEFNDKIGQTKENVLKILKEVVES